MVTSARFVEMTESGVEATYRNGEEADHYSILESLGGGVGWLDYDQDGWPDLFLPGGGQFTGSREIAALPGKLFRNQGGWKFRDVTAPSGCDRADHYSHAAIAADSDSDGFPDLLITGYGGAQFFRNQGDGTLIESAAAAGLTDRMWSSVAAWGDFNGDGHLDLYLGHYTDWSFDNDPFCPGLGPTGREVCPPRDLGPLPGLLYVSCGDGTFRDGSAESGLNLPGKNLGVLAADIDLDGDLDLYVANDYIPNYLFFNDGHGKFRDAGPSCGAILSDVGLPTGSMGVDLGDFNLDGRPDIWVTNYEREVFALYRNDGGGLFQHVSQPMGITALGGTYVGWGTVFFDFDNDGDEDLFISNGHVQRFPASGLLKQPAVLFENDGGRRFVNVSSAAGKYFQRAHLGRGAAAADVDNDGRLDLAVSRTNEPAVLLRNDSSGNHCWLGLRLVGTRSARDAIGAKIRVTSASGQIITRQVKGGGSYASSADARVFVGLGASHSAVQIEICWPSGEIQAMKDILSNQLHTFVEPAVDPSRSPGRPD